MVHVSIDKVIDIMRQIETVLSKMENNLANSTVSHWCAAISMLDHYIRQYNLGVSLTVLVANCIHITTFALHKI